MSLVRREGFFHLHLFSLEPPGNKTNSGKVRLSNLKVTIDDQSIDGYYSPASDNVDNGLLVKYFMVCAHTPLLI